MSDRWRWAEPIRERRFGTPVLGTYRLERVDADRYWDIHEAELRRYFPPDAYFDPAALVGEARRRARDRVVAAEGAERLEDNWLVRAEDGVLAGVFSVNQRNRETFELYHVTLHPDHRGRGLYREILGRVLAYAEELGFSTTVSEHSPSNNPVLIAHLRAGFRIVAFDINPLYGPAVRLAYFHEPALLKAYEFRCGLAVMDERLHAAGFGHFALLDDQFAAARAENVQERPPP